MNNLWKLVISMPLLAGVSVGLIAVLPAHASPSGATEYPTTTANSYPTDIVTGPDGNLWFTEANADKIGKITPSGTVTEYPIPTANASPDGITVGPNDNLWFTETGGNNIGEITTGGQVTEFPLPVTNSNPGGIVTGPDGNLWFTQTGGYIGKITPTGSVTEYPIPTSDDYTDSITVGPDGNLWFTEMADNMIGKITPGGSVTEYPIPTANSYPFGIANSDGNLWFTEAYGNKIGKITTDGTITEYPIPTAYSNPNDITATPDGNLWFTEHMGNNVGEITQNGNITEYPIPTGGSGPIGITMGPDYNIWFTEAGSSKIGQIIPSDKTSPGSTGLTYVALGDSYSSGEGAPDPSYIPGTNLTDYNLCHRSIAAYPELVHDSFTQQYSNFVFEACSGATIRDFYHTNDQPDRKGEPPQLDWLNSNTSLVTMTIGGNNVDFEPVMRYCATRSPSEPSCEAMYNSAVNSDIASISSTNPKNPYTLPSLFKAVKKDAPNAKKILIVGYPRLFPDNPPEKCTIGFIIEPHPTYFQRSDMLWINTEGAKLDAAIKQAAVNQGLTYVDTYNAFSGHELCSSNPYINGIVLETSKTPIKIIDQGSFHPNITGQQVLATSVENAL